MGIILMVLRHARAPHSDFVLLFHMAVFFIASGSLYNGSKIRDFHSLIQYIYKKIRGLWLPYFAFNSIYILLNNIFISAKIYTNNAAFLSADGEELTYRSLAEYYSLTDMIKKIIKAAFFHGDTQIGGALWFFYVLFVVLILYAATDLLLLKISKPMLKKVIKGIIAATFLSVGYICMIRGISLKGLCRVFSVYPLIYIGELFREWKGKERLKENAAFALSTLVIAIAVLFISYHTGYIDLSSNSIDHPAFFLIASACGWLMLYNAAILLQQVNFAGNKMICYFSIHSVPIIGMHFLCFKIVNAIAVAVTRQEKYMIAAHPVLMYSGCWWVLYTVLGLTLPLAANFIFWKCLRESHCISRRWQ